MSEPTAEQTAIRAARNYRNAVKASYRVRCSEDGFSEAMAAKRETGRELDDALVTLEAQRLPLLADPAHTPSADDEQDERYEKGLREEIGDPRPDNPAWRPNQYHASDMAFLLRRLDAALLALSGAQADQHHGDLFVDGEFVAHSGDTLSYKIECDALSDASIACLAKDYARHHQFGAIHGIPRGGLRLAAALEPYITEGPVVIADDVLTTGGSMEQARIGKPETTIGVVIFARGLCPSWVTPLWWSPEAHQADLALRNAEIERLNGIIECCGSNSEDSVKRLTQQLYHIPTKTEEAAAAVIDASDVLLAQSREIARLKLSLERTRASLRLLIAQSADPGSEALTAEWEAGDTIARLDTVVNTPHGADAMEIACDLRHRLRNRIEVERQRGESVDALYDWVQAEINTAIEAADARGEARERELRMELIDEMETAAVLRGRETVRTYELAPAVAERDALRRKLDAAMGVVKAARKFTECNLNPNSPWMPEEVALVDTLATFKDQP